MTEQFHKPEIGLASFKDTAMFCILKDISDLLHLNGSFLENIFSAPNDSGKWDGAYLLIKLCRNLDDILQVG